MNGIEKVVDLLAAIILLFMAPLMYYGSGTTITQAMLAGQAGENFLRRISTSGEITLPVWQELEAMLERYGCDTFELQRERSLYEPGPGQGGVTEQVYAVHKEKMREQVWKVGSYKLRKGDRMRLTLYINDIPTVYFCWVRTGATDG